MKYILLLFRFFLSIFLFIGMQSNSEGQTTKIYDDMEHGDPFNNGWFTFEITGSGNIDANSSDLPPADGGSFSLQADWTSDGTIIGGFGRTFPFDLSETAHFNFWINPDAGQDYTIEINLQEDDNGDGVLTNPNDDEFQYNFVVSSSGPGVISGGGWQLVSIPLSDFFDDNTFYMGGNGILDAGPASGGGNGQLINVVFAIINSLTDVSFRTDYWTFSSEPLVELNVELKVYLEGCYNSGSMTTSLVFGGDLPTLQPYNTAPWNYSGSEILSDDLYLNGIAFSIVDWVLIELRDKTNSSQVISRRAAFLKRNGTITDIDGSSSVKFIVSNKKYFVSVHHRNHLPIMSANPLSLSNP